MNNIYYINKKKNTLLLMLISIIFLLGGVGILKMDLQLSTKIPIITVVVGFGIFSIKRVLSDYKTKITIDEKQINMVRYNENVTVKWECVSKIRYQGIDSIIIFDNMIIEGAGDEKIYLDYNINDYKTLWRVAVQKYTEINDNVIIDERIIGKI